MVVQEPRPRCTDARSEGPLSSTLHRADTNPSRPCDQFRRYVGGVGDCALRTRARRTDAFRVHLRGDATCAWQAGAKTVQGVEYPVVWALLPYQGVLVRSRQENGVHCAALREDRAADGIREADSGTCLRVPLKHATQPGPTWRTVTRATHQRTKSDSLPHSHGHVLYQRRNVGTNVGTRCALDLQGQLMIARARL